MLGTHRNNSRGISRNTAVLGNFNKFLLPILGIAIVLLLVYMVWDLAEHRQTTEEGFSARQSDKLAKLKSRESLKNTRSPSPNQSKLSMMKNGKYNPNQDLKSYGMDGGNKKDTESENDNNSAEDLDSAISNLGTEIGEKTLNHLASKKSKGKRDNFKNVINEIDNINPGAFDFTSIGGTIRRYNENFNNRLNYAKSKNEGDNLEATMAQGKIIFDEFKKIFLFTDMFS